MALILFLFRWLLGYNWTNQLRLILKGSIYSMKSIHIEATTEKIYWSKAS